MNINDSDLLENIFTVRGQINNPRELKFPDDWGDDATRMLNLKSKGYYFGEYEGKYYVGVKGKKGEVIKMLPYDSLEALKNEWECENG